MVSQRKGVLAIRNEHGVLADVAQCVGCHHPENQKVASLIPSQGTCLGFKPGPQMRVSKRQPVVVCLAH